MVAIKNEKGYTLVIVMVIITVAMIFGLSLSAMALNANKQFNKTDNRNKATDLAEMGITFYLTSIKDLIITAKSDAITNKTDFCTEINKQISTTTGVYQPQTVEGDNKYQISFTSITPCTSKPASLDISFLSTGMTGKENVTIKGGFTISRKTRVGDTAPTIGEYNLNGDLDKTYSSNEKIYYGDLSSTQKNSYDLLNSAWFKNLTLRGNGNKSDNLTLENRDSIFKSISLNGGTILKINGDAIFIDPSPTPSTITSPIDKETNKATLCIIGDTYNVVNGKLQAIDISQFNDCQNLSGVNNWTINEDTGISVNYNTK